MKKSREAGFGFIGLLVLLAILVISGVVIWRLYSGSQEGATDQPNDVKQAGILIDKWHITIPNIADHQITLAKDYGGPAYGSSIDSKELFLPEFDSKFTCSVEGAEPHRATFAIIAQFNKDSDMAGPYKPDATAVVDDKKYGLYAAGHNCYDKNTTSKVKEIYSKYAADFTAKITK